jgi:Zn-dependent protease
LPASGSASNWSWLIVFALIVWTLGASVVSAQDPHLSSGTYAAMANVAAFLFFSSLLLHELGHALQARREGVEIEGITLWLCGGVDEVNRTTTIMLVLAGRRNRQPGDLVSGDRTRDLVVS